MCKGWVPALMLAVAWGSSIAAAKDEKCALTQVASVTVSGSNVVILPVKLRGSDAWVYFNTGTPFSNVYADTVKKFGLPLQKLPRLLRDFSFGGKQLDELAGMASLQIGNVTFGNNTAFLVVPGAITQYLGHPLIGTLGLDAFVHVDFELDLAHRKLNLFSQEHCPGGVYWADAAASVPMQRDRWGNFYFPMELEGKRIQTTLSTGQLNSSLHTDVSKRVFEFDEHSPATEVESVAGQPQTYYRAMKLTNPGLTISNAKIQLLSPHEGCKVDVPLHASDPVGYYGCSAVYPLQLGLEELRKLRLYFATREHVLYFTAADAGEH